MTDHILDTDYANLTGELKIVLKFQNGIEVPFFEDKNVITDVAKGHLLAMIYDQSQSVVPDPITSFRVGDGGTLDGTTGPGGLPGVNPRPLSGAEENLFNEISTGLYSSTAISHTLENATTANAGVWAATTAYNLADRVSATSASLSQYVFEATNAGTSSGSEPDWPPVLGETVTDGTIVWVTRPRELASKSVTYSFNISPTQLNSYNLSEVAMYRNSDTMFNIKTFPSIPKSAAFAIQFIWTIKYV